VPHGFLLVALLFQCCRSLNVDSSKSEVLPTWLKTLGGIFPEEVPAQLAAYSNPTTPQMQVMGEDEPKEINDVQSEFITILERPAWTKSGLVETNLSIETEHVLVRPQQFEALQHHHEMVTGGGSKLNLLNANPDFEKIIIKNLGSEYVGSIGIGTIYEPKGCHKEGSPDAGGCSSVHEQEKLSVVFDTGSTNLWMASTLCTSGPCVLGSRKRFDFKQSDTFEKPEVPKQLDIEFGTAQLKGPLGIDDFHIGPFTVKKQKFGMIQEEYGSTFRELELEGIVGLAFPNLAAAGTEPFFDSVIQQKVLKRNMFCFYLQPWAAASALLADGSVDVKRQSGGAILWGGYDPDLFDGEIAWFPVTDAYYWALDLHSFWIGNESLTITQSEEAGSASLTHMRKHKRKASDKVPARLILDSGTTYFAADGKLYHEIAKRIPSADCKAADHKYPPIYYKLKDVDGKMHDLEVPQTQYMVQSGTRRCEMGFMKVGPDPEYGPAMILGELFMQMYFTIFDRGDGSDNGARVGFAKTKQWKLASLRQRSLMSLNPPRHDAQLKPRSPTSRFQGRQTDGRATGAIVPKEQRLDGAADSHIQKTVNHATHGQDGAAASRIQKTPMSASTVVRHATRSVAEIDDVAAVHLELENVPQK